MDVSEIIKPAIVAIRDDTAINGTGFFITSDGYILTCYHVVGPLRSDDNPAKVIIEDAAGREFMAYIDEEKSCNDKEIDFAVLKVKFNEVFPCLPLGKDFKIGDQWNSRGYGFPETYRDNPNSGKISCSSSRRMMFGFDIKLESDYPVREGESGSPVLDEGTKLVVGIIKQIPGEKSDKECFAVPIEDVLKKWPDLEDLNRDSELLIDVEFLIKDHSSDQWWEKGLEMLKEGKYKRSIKYFDYAIALDPEWGAPWRQKGHALLRLDKYRDSIEVLNKAIELDSNYFAWLDKGECHFYLEEYNQAIRAYEKAHSLDVERYEPWSNKLMVLIILGKYHEAINYADEIINLYKYIPKYHQKALHIKGKALSKQGKYFESIEVFNKAIEINAEDRENADIWCSKGADLETIGCYLGECPDMAYDEAIRLDPKSINAWKRKGNYLFGQILRYPNMANYSPEECFSRCTEALKCYRKVIELDPSNECANSNIQNLSLIWIRAGSYHEKSAQYSLWEKGSPFYTDHEKEALNAYNKALEIDPDNYCIWWYKYQYFEKFGHKLQAEASLKKYHSLKPPNVISWCPSP